MHPSTRSSFPDDPRLVRWAKRPSPCPWTRCAGLRHSWMQPQCAGRWHPSRSRKGPWDQRFIQSIIKTTTHWNLCFFQSSKGANFIVFYCYYSKNAAIIYILCPIWQNMVSPRKVGIFICQVGDRRLDARPLPLRPRICPALIWTISVQEQHQNLANTDPLFFWVFLMKVHWSPNINPQQCDHWPRYNTSALLSHHKSWCNEGGVKLKSRGDDSGTVLERSILVPINKRIRWIRPSWSMMHSFKWIQVIRLELLPWTGNAPLGTKSTH